MTNVLTALETREIAAGVKIAQGVKTAEDVETVESVEGRVVRCADRPIDFETFLDLSFSMPHKRDMELVAGVMVEKMSAQLTHEKLFAWLFPIMNLFAKRRNLGVVFGSRTAVEIDAYHGRLPDLLFVRRERSNIIRERAIYGPPDLVIEIVSPNDRPSDLIAVESDYRTLGVAEIVFIDMPRQRMRVVRKDESGQYAEEVLTTGAWQSSTLAGLTLQTSWLLTEPRPDELDTLQALLQAAAAPSNAESQTDNPTQT